MDSNLPAKIGKYDVIEVIGRGGMGVVYKANDPHLDRIVAIKMITSGFAENPAQLKRFFVEAKSLASLVHPNIVTVYDLGDFDGNPYLVMQYLEGEDLDTVLVSRRSLSLLDKMNIITQMCEGLSYAHRRNVVHRDIKPANIMLASDGVIKIFDFGIAKVGDPSATKSASQIMGTLYYMSPEQVNGRPVDWRSDLFSTGVVLYQLVTGHLPFEGESTTTTLLKITREPPPPLANFLSVYPPELEAILQRALAKDREDRYQSADEFALDLRQLQGHLKQELIARNMEEVALLMERSDLQKAKERLVQVLRIDQQNTKANQLLRELQVRMQREEVDGQVAMLRERAAEALEHDQFQAAQEAVDRALVLDKNNTDLQNLREEVRQASVRAEKLHIALKCAEAAHNEGRLDEAKQAVEEALALAPDDSHAKGLYRLIHREWVERSRQKQMENFVAAARQEIAARRFTAALEILQQAQTLDPDAPQVQALLESAVTGQTQERRRREIEAISRRIEDALNADDYRTACREASDGLGRFPGDRSLLKLQALAEKQRQAAERKQFVDEKLAQARQMLQEKRNNELLVSLEATLAEIGPEPRLESLLSLVKENLERERIEQQKSECLRKATDLLQNQEYDEAIAMLEASAKDSPDDPEIAELLERIRAERSDLVKGAIKRSQQESSLDLRYRILEEALAKTPNEPELQEQLDGVQWLGRLIASIANEARTLEQSHQYDQALAKWESLRSTYSHYPELDGIIDRVTRLRDEAKADARSVWISKIQSALIACDYAQAITALAEAEQDFPWDSDFMEFRQKAEVGAKLRAKAEKALNEGRKLLANEQWEQGADAVVRACQSAREDRVIQEQGQTELVAQSKAVLQRNWRAAESLLARLAQLHPDFAVPKELQARIAELRREETLKDALSAAKKKQLSGDLRGAVKAVQEALASYPDETRLLSLRNSLEEQIRQAEEKERQERARAEKEAFVAGVLQRAEQERSLDSRVRILEAGLREQPGESRIQQRLEQARDLSRKVTSLAEDARSLERERKYAQALAKWESLRAVFRDYPDVDRELERVKTLQQRVLAENRGNLARQLRAALDACDFEAAEPLLAEAKREFPGDKEFAAMEAKVNDGVERRARAMKHLREAQKAAEKAKWSKAAESFRLANESVSADIVVNDATFRGLFEASRAALRDDPDAAEMLLNEAQRVNQQSSEIAPLYANIQAQKRARGVEECSNAAKRIWTAGDLEGAFRELDRGLGKYPDEARLLRQRKDIEDEARALAEKKRVVRAPGPRRAPTQPLQSTSPDEQPQPAQDRPASVSGREVPTAPPVPWPQNTEVVASSNPPLEKTMRPPASNAAEMTTIDMPSPGPQRTEVVPTTFDDSLRTMMIDPTGERSAELHAIEKELVVFLGPLARVVVKRAAAKTTDSDELWRILAKSLERESDRDAFLARREAFHRKGYKPPAAPPLPAAPLTTAINPASALGITPEAIDHAARALATHVGPISGVLAKKAAQRADSLRSFYVLLSEHVQNGKDRRRFLRDAGFPDA